MSFFSRKSGGKKKKGSGPSTGEAIQKLRDTEEMLVKKQEYLESKVDRELTIAKQNATKNKRVALQALKRKKKYEQQLGQIDGTLSTIEFQREALESANTNTSVLQTMGSAAKALKAAHQNMDVDNVHDLMDDISEQQELAKEITDAISGATFHDDIDEDDLMAELEELEQETLDEKLLETGALPSVPTTALPKVSAKSKNKEREQHDDFAELAAWAS